VRISAAVIVRNEEANIDDLCKSIDWADEIVIVDSDSTDRTVEIAKKYTSKIFNREFKGYRDKHEFADAQTTCDWILWIDADERVSTELKNSIAALREKQDNELADGYKISRKTFFMNRWIRHCGWSPDYQMRLYRKSKSYWDGVAPHQTARVDGRVETLAGELLHYTKRNLSEYHRVLDSYTTLAAEQLTANGKTVGGIGIFIGSVAAFIRTYIVKQGFLDGVPGLMISIFTAYGVFLRLAKVWERNREN
jgi:glycosyltransferase involved in cell wall biosynthesis